jgi:hypothetical protein
MGWAMLYLFVALKLPIVAACLIIWWAVRQEPDYASDDSDGGSRTRPHPVPPLPRPPRRGPHGDAVPGSPPRIRPPASAPRRSRV